MKTSDQLEPNMFVIFGGAGDLTWRKLMPALFDLSQNRSMPGAFRDYRGGPRRTQRGALRKRLQRASTKFARAGKVPSKEWNEFAKHIRYLHGDFKSHATYTELASSATGWKRSGEPRPSAFSTWPRRPSCSARFPPSSTCRPGGRPGMLAHRHREAHRVRPGVRAGAEPHARQRFRANRRSSASTITWARRPCRTFWRSVSPIRCSSRSGTGATWTT